MAVRWLRRPAREEAGVWGGRSPGKNTATPCKNLTIGSTLKTVNSEEVEGYSDPSREVAWALRCSNDGTWRRRSKDLHGERRGVRWLTTGARGDVDDHSPWRGDSGLRKGAVETPVFYTGIVAWHCPNWQWEHGAQWHYNWLVGPTRQWNSDLKQTWNQIPAREKYLGNKEKSGKIRVSIKSNLEHFSLLTLLPNLHRF
jgi:hypothetical protein